MQGKGLIKRPLTHPSHQSCRIPGPRLPSLEPFLEEARLTVWLSVTRVVQATPLEATSQVTFLLVLTGVGAGAGALVLALVHSSPQLQGSPSQRSDSLDQFLNAVSTSPPIPTTTPLHPSRLLVSGPGDELK